MAPSLVGGCQSRVPSPLVAETLFSPSCLYFTPNHSKAGLVVANDSERRRCHLLVHQTKRLQSPTFMIINHDASVLPSMKFLTEVRLGRSCRWR